MHMQFTDALSHDDFISSIYDLAPNNLVFFDENGDVCMCNEATCKLFKCENEKELISNFSNLYPLKQPSGENSASCLKKYVKKALTGKEVTFDWGFIDTVGKPLQINVKLTKYSGNDFIKNTVVMGILQDVSAYELKYLTQKNLYEHLISVFDNSPLSLSIWNEDNQMEMCNQTFADLFEVENKQFIIDNFHKLSPELQPDGSNSEDLAINKLREGFDNESSKFMWLHCKLNGEEIPAEIILKKLPVKDLSGRSLVAAYLKALSPQTEQSNESDLVDEYYFNQISDKKLFEMLAQLSDELFFSLEIKTSMIQFYGKGSKIFGLSEEKEIFPEKILEDGKIFEDDVVSFIELSNDMKKGVNKPFEIRFMQADGQSRYYKFNYKTICNKRGDPILCIGKATDIDEQKTLEILSKTDLLTNCFNKISSENLITDALLDYRDASHAIYIIDIDNFKAINDNLGHHFGDMVLSEVAANLRNCFRNADIIGRIGGDEFIVLLKNVQNENVVEQKAKIIAKAFQNTYSGEYNDYKISGSIGISCYPKDGKTYEELYKAADKALYQSKLRGKDCYTFYTDELYDGTMKNRTTLENASRIANSYFDTELVSTVFDLMYETREIHSSLNAVMKFICKRANADRCYIFETHDNGKTYDNTYEWCANGIVPEIENLQGLTADILFDFFANSDDKGIFYSNDLRLLKADGAYDLMNDQGIKSFLHVQIREKDYVKLFLGLDDCTRTRVWNEKEINSILYAVKMISIFLLSDQKSMHKNGN